jgi:4-diphosphocytidyl-2-C-methyl-D-erythritol kinase|tara:strand:- start:2065 stop:2907 length:843 start_codon:yes stop_codon:yes gene_type:complete
MVDSLKLSAPGKLNLFLLVLGRRPDGYHRIQTLFQLVDCCDQLEFARGPGAEIDVLGDFGDLPPADNLIHRAASLLQKTVGHQAGVSISVVKKIPMGGGMGGGSSDAATTLLGLNELWRLGLGLEDLLALGSQIGADVPVFIRGKTAWGEGTGDQLAPLQLAPKWYLVIVPECRVSTAEIFRHNELTRNSSAIKIADFLRRDAGNDCEAVVRSLYPEVDNALKWLSRWAPAKMTGTGSSVFAGFDDRLAADKVLSEVPAKWDGFITEGINDSPLHMELDL